MGRKTRTIPPAIRRALTSRDRGCRFPGCSFRRYVDGHHVRHWADGGETKLSNLVTLCRFHHRLVHEGQAFVRTLDDGAFRFIRSNGESFDSPLPPAANGRAIVVASESAGLCIRPTTAVTNWMGEALDLDFAIETLLQLRGNGKNVPAGTSAGRAARRRARESSVP